MKILKGSFRFISGLISKKKPRSMSVGITVATIGIRGTHVAGEVDPTSARIVLMELDDPSAPIKESTPEGGGFEITPERG